MRPYQSVACDAFFDGLASCRAQLLVMATGLGKTVVMSEVARRWHEDGRPGRVMVIAHREELVSQAADKLERVTGAAPGVEMAELRGGHLGSCVVATVQTVSARLGKFRPEEIGLLMIDEAHHAVATSYRKVIEHFAAAKILGVTATPKRADDLALGQVFDRCCHDYGIMPAIEDGWLVQVAQRAVEVEDLDFSEVRQVCGDLHEGELEEVLRREKVLHGMAVPIVSESGDRPTLVFCATVRHAHELCAVIERYKPNSAVALDGRTPRDVRRQQVERFKRGEVQYLLNCGLFLEGFDAPATACVAMCRPTKSLALYMQVLGRGTRPLPGVVDGVETEAARVEAIRQSSKPDVLVLDFVGNSGRHKIVTALDVLGGKHTVQAREYAARLAQQDDRPATVPDALERAEADLAFLREMHEMRRLREVKARVAYSATHVDPFQGGLRGTAYHADRPQAEAATEKQVWYLVRRAGWKHADAAKLSKKQASAVIGRHREAELSVGGGGW
jgi:superfamily II DNA or RNA helicase